MTRTNQTLDELLADPMIQLLMRRDGWEGDDVRMLLDRVRPAAEHAVVPPAHVIGTQGLRQWTCR